MPQASKKLKFPLERQERYKASIIFQPLQIIPLDSTVFDETIEIAQVAETINDNELDQEDANFGNTNQNNFFEGNLKGTLRTRRSKDTCELYAPASLAFNDRVDINNASLGALGLSGIAAGGEGLSGFAGAAIQSIIQGGKSFAQIASSGDIGSTARVSAVRAANRFLPGQGLQSAVSIGLQVQANPNQRSVFGGVAVRTFTFNFKFIPLSEKESREIQNIIKWFRTELYPRSINISDKFKIPFGYEYPNLFDIKIKYNRELVKNMDILPCYLSSMQHNYNSSSMTWHPDGSPTEVDMSLTFIEYRTLHKGDIDKKYDPDYYDGEENNLEL